MEGDGDGPGAQLLGSACAAARHASCLQAGRDEGDNDLRGSHAEESEWKRIVNVVDTETSTRGYQMFRAIGVADDLELAVIYTWREGRRRIISARRARHHEREAYREAYPGGSGQGPD